MISVYGWKGATWIIAGIVLNGVAVGALFRPLEPESPRRNSPQIVVDTGEHEVIDETLQSKTLLSEKNGKADGAIIGENGKISQPVNKNLLINSDVTDNDLARSCGHLPTHMLLEKTKGNFVCRSMDDVTLYRKKELDKLKIKELQSPLHRKDIFYSGSIAHLAEFQSQKDLDSYHRSITNIPTLDQTDGGSKGNYFVRMCWSMLSVFREMMDFSLLKNPVFAFYGASCFLCMLGKDLSLFSIHLNNVWDTVR